MVKVFLVAIFYTVTLCQPTYGAMWRASEKNTIRVDLRECEDAAEDGLKIGSERIGNRNRFVLGEERTAPRNYEVQYFLYKDKIWWMGVYTWENYSRDNARRVERRFFCHAAPLEEPSLAKQDRVQ